MAEIHVDTTLSALEIHVDADVVQPVVIESHMGLGPVGGTPVVLIDAADWPPIDPVDGTLYLKGE